MLRMMKICSFLKAFAATVGTLRHSTAILFFFHASLHVAFHTADKCSKLISCEKLDKIQTKLPNPLDSRLLLLNLFFLCLPFAI